MEEGNGWGISMWICEVGSGRVETREGGEIKGIGRGYVNRWQR